MGEAQGQLDSRRRRRDDWDSERPLQRSESYTGSSDQIKQNIDETRAHIDTLLGELGERLHPRQLFAMTRNWWRERRERPKTIKAGETVKQDAQSVALYVREHLWSLGMIASGLTLLLFNLDETISRSAQDRSRRFVSGSKEQLRKATSETATRVKEKVQGAVQQKLDSGKWSERRSQGREFMRERREQGREFVRERMRRSSDTFQVNPLGVAGVMLGLGMAAGLLFPSTRREDELMGEASTEMKKQAGKIADASVSAGLEHAQKEVAEKERAGSQYAS